jgi:5-methylcytosine-specific restriction endonuclease McrA
MISSSTKICATCGLAYGQNPNTTVQKYCSRSCKDKMAWEKRKETGHIRAKKGGYNRETYINLFLSARQTDQTAPCHYAQFDVNPNCQERVTSTDFVLDHKRPLAELKTRSEMLDPENLVVCCKSCNNLKNTTSYENFINRKDDDG